MALTDWIFSRFFSMSIKHGMSEKVWLPNYDPDTVENSSNFKWIKVELRSNKLSTPEIQMKILSVINLRTQVMATNID